MDRREVGLELLGSLHELISIFLAPDAAACLVPHHLRPGSRQSHAHCMHMHARRLAHHQEHQGRTGHAKQATPSGARKPNMRCLG